MNDKTDLSEALAAHGSDPSTGDVYLQALRRHLEGDCEAAERLLRQLVRVSPSNQAAWFLLGDLLTSRGEHGEVASVILPALRAAAGAGESEHFWLTHADVLTHMDPARLGDARQSCKNALRKRPMLLAAWSRLLLIDERIGEVDAMVADAEAALCHWPEQATAHAILGRHMAAQGRCAEAEAHLRRSLLRAPCAETHCALSSVLSKLSRHAEAEEHARHAIRLSPCSAHAWLRLGQVCRDQGRLADADETLLCASRLAAAKDQRRQPTSLAAAVAGRQRTPE